MSVLGAAAIGAGASLLTGLLSSSSASSSNKLTQEENQKNRDWQEYMWNQYNEYNLPVNQVARLQQAGLNPALMYGTSGSTDSGSASSMAGAPSTNNQFQQTFSPQTIQSIAQLINAGVQSSLAQSEVDKNYGQLFNIDLDSEQRKTLLDTLSQRYQLEIDNLSRNNNLIDAMTASTLTGVEKMEYEMRNIQKETERLDVLISNIKIDDTLKGEMAGYFQQLRKNYSRKLAADIALQESQGRNNDAQSELYKSQRNLNESIKRAQDLTNTLLDKYGDDEKQASVLKTIYEGLEALKNSNRMDIWFVRGLETDVTGNTSKPARNLLKNFKYKNSLNN